MPSGVFDSTVKRFRAIRDGELLDPKSLGALYEFPDAMLKSGEFLDRKNWYISNPNLGASVDIEYLLEQQEKAEREGKPSLVSWMAKHLNVETKDFALTDGRVPNNGSTE